MKNAFNDDDFKLSSFCLDCQCCVEVAHKDNIVAIRDTKDMTKTMLKFTKEEWQAFVQGVKNGEFDF